MQQCNRLSRMYKDRSSRCSRDTFYAATQQNLQEVQQLNQALQGMQQQLHLVAASGLHIKDLLARHCIKNLLALF